VNGHHLDAVMAPLVHLDVLDLLDGPLLLAVLAEDTCVIFVEDAAPLIQNYELHLASVHEDNSEDHDQDRNKVLPPVSLSIAFEKNSILA
jgi:hypothetical protein